MNEEAKKQQEQDEEDYLAMKPLVEQAASLCAEYLKKEDRQMNERVIMWIRMHFLIRESKTLIFCLKEHRDLYNKMREQFPTLDAHLNHCLELARPFQTSLSDQVKHVFMNNFPSALRFKLDDLQK